MEWVICHFREDELTLIQLEIGSSAGCHQLFLRQFEFIDVVSDDYYPNAMTAVSRTDRLDMQPLAS